MKNVRFFFRVMNERSSKVKEDVLFQSWVIRRTFLSSLTLLPVPLFHIIYYVKGSSVLSSLLSQTNSGHEIY